jgi:hypothetical protein
MMSIAPAWLFQIRDNPSVPGSREAICSRFATVLTSGGRYFAMTAVAANRLFQVHAVLRLTE